MLPEPNTFIAENFTVEKMETKVSKISPDIIIENDKMRLWHKKDDTFFIPKANGLYNLMCSLI